MNGRARIALSGLLLALLAAGPSRADAGIEGRWDRAGLGVEIRKEGELYNCYYTRVTANMKANGAAPGDLGWELRAEEGGESFVGRIKAWGLRGPGFRWLSRFRITLNGDVFVFQWYRTDELTYQSAKYTYMRSEESTPSPSPMGSTPPDPGQSGHAEMPLGPDEAAYALAARLENLSREFFQVWSEQRFDAILEYLTGEVKDQFIEFREDLQEDPDLKQFVFVPERWRIEGSQSIESNSDAIVVASVDSADYDGMRLCKLVWTETRYGWRLSKLEEVDDDEELELKKHLPPEINRAIREVLEELTSALETFDVEGILAHTTGQAAQELADAVGSEQGLEDAKEMFLGSFIHIGSIELGDDDLDELRVSVTIEHKDAENTEIEWLFRPVRGKWKLARKFLSPV